MKHAFMGMSILIGSVPNIDPKDIIPVMLDTTPECPTWPQLPKRFWKEDMFTQFSAQLPGLIVDECNKNIHVDRQQDNYPELLVEFYEKALQAIDVGCYSDFSIDKEVAAGLEPAVKFLSSNNQPPPFIKIHVTGPISFGIALKDEKQNPLLFDDDYRDILIRNCTLKALWQASLFKKIGSEIICFIDEPSLSSFGSSAMITVSAEMVKSTLSAIVSDLKTEQIITAVHVCGNSDWPVLIDSGFDIINFDAYGYGENIALYSNEINEFLKNGGALAWGIVPTNEKVLSETSSSLMDKFEHYKDNLVKNNISEEIICRQCIFTPSCGMGGMEIENSQRVMGLLSEISKLFRSKYFS